MKLRTHSDIHTMDRSLKFSVKKEHSNIRQKELESGRRITVTVVLCCHVINWPTGSPAVYT